MGATVTVLTKPYFSLNGVDYSEQVKELKLPFSLDELEVTASGDTSHVSVPGLEKWSAEASVYRTAALDTALWGMKGTVVPLKFRKSTDAIGADNPEYQGNVFIAGYPLMGGGIGTVDEITISMSAASALSRATS